MGQFAFLPAICMSKDLVSLTLFPRQGATQTTSALLWLPYLPVSTSFPLEPRCTWKLILCHFPLYQGRGAEGSGGERRGEEGRGPTVTRKQVLLAVNGSRKCYICTMWKDAVNESQTSVCSLKDQGEQCDSLMGTSTGSTEH